MRTVERSYIIIEINSSNFSTGLKPEFDLISLSLKLRRVLDIRRDMIPIANPVTSGYAING